MSNAGQAVLTIAGGVIGAFIGGPAGASLGLSLGSLSASGESPYDAARKDCVSIPLDCIYQDAAQPMLKRRTRSDGRR